MAVSTEVEQARRLASRAQGQLRRLQALKFQSLADARNPNERVQWAKPGPRGPAVGEAAVDLELDLTFALHEDLSDLADLSGLPRPPRDLDACLSWAFDWAGDVVDLRSMLEALENQVAKLSDFVARHSGAPRRELAWGTPQQVVDHLARLGVRVTPGQLRAWAARGHVAKRQEAGRNVYRLCDVVAYLNGRVMV